MLYKEYNLWFNRKRYGITSFLGLFIKICMSSILTLYYYDIFRLKAHNQSTIPSIIVLLKVLGLIYKFSLVSHWCCYCMVDKMVSHLFFAASLTRSYNTLKKQKWMCA